MALFEVHPLEGLTLKEIAENVTIEEVRWKTEATFKVADDLIQMEI